MTNKELAEKYFFEGYACSQAIVMAFKEHLKIDEETLLKISLPFGGGLGRLRLTCGAFSGMCMVISLMYAKNEVSEENKKAVYAIVQELSKRFTKKLGTLNCKELLEKASLDVEIGGNPEPRSQEYYKKRPCGKIVYLAAEILEEYIKEKSI